MKHTSRSSIPAQESQSLESDIKPFESESQVLSLGNLNLEFRLDRVSFIGDLDITRDQQGLALAHQLQSVLNRVVQSLESAELPERVLVKEKSITKNPFN
jgi:hypothetical protein